MNLIAELRRHLEENPSVRLGMEPKIYVNMCLGAVNWCYKWYHPDGPLSAAQLGQQMAGTLTASLS